MRHVAGKELWTELTDDDQFMPWAIRQIASEADNREMDRPRAHLLNQKAKEVHKELLRVVSDRKGLIDFRRWYRGDYEG
jgi:hypothetical protein